MLQRNVASYLQTLCLVESFRTSFSDLLSLVSVFNGDIRRAMLALQVWLETGSTCHQQVAAPIHRPDVSITTSNPNDIGTDESAHPKVAADATKPSGSQSVDSGDEFVQVRPRKRRALRVASSDEDSQSLDGALASLAPVANDNSGHQHCEDSSASATVNTSEQSAVSADTATEMVADQPSVAMEASLAPPIHQLSLSTVGHLESLPRGSRIKLQVRLIPVIMQENAVAFSRTDVR